MARKALARATRQLVGALARLDPEAAWLVACSGGPDSLALAWAAQHLGVATATPVRAVVVDHQLQRGSAAIAAKVASQLAGFGCPATVVAVVVSADGGGREAAAREARYGALDAEASRWGAALGRDVQVLLGHTRNDQAESVLLGLARGSGTRSLAGMAESVGRYRRPLLDLARATTEDACAELGLTWWRDPHNDDPAFARVRVRHRVLPMLESELGPGIAEALARTATLTRADADYLDAIAGAVWVDTEPDCGQLSELGEPIRRRVLRRWLGEQGVGEVSYQNVLAVERLIFNWRGQSGVDLPGLRVTRARGRLRTVAR